MAEHPSILHHFWHLVLPTIPAWLWITVAVIFGLALWAVLGTTTVAILNKLCFDGDSDSDGLFEVLGGILWPIALAITAIALLIRPFVQLCNELYHWILER